MNDLRKFVGDKLTPAQAEALGRAVFAGAVLNDGHVALVHIVDHKRAVGVCSAYGDEPETRYKLMIYPNGWIKSPREYEEEMQGKV